MTATFRTMNTLHSATPSLKELERVLDSCRMELKEIDEVWPNLYLGNMFQSSFIQMELTALLRWQNKCPPTLTALMAIINASQQCVESYATRVLVRRPEPSPMCQRIIMDPHLPSVIAHNKEELRRRGITHILNAAHAAWGSRGSQVFYGQEVHYYGIAAEDCIDFDLSIHFRPASEYIHKALSAPNGKILVHCILGKSRSAALVLAYLMSRQNFSLADAIERVLQQRAISPNRGFLKQLQDLDLELRYKISPCQLL